MFPLLRKNRPNPLLPPALFDEPLPPPIDRVFGRNLWLPLPTVELEDTMLSSDSRDFLVSESSDMTEHPLERSIGKIWNSLTESESSAGTCDRTGGSDILRRGGIDRDSLRATPALAPCMMCVDVYSTKETPDRAICLHHHFASIAGCSPCLCDGEQERKSARRSLLIFDTLLVIYDGQQKNNQTAEYRNLVFHNNDEIGTPDSVAFVTPLPETVALRRRTTLNPVFPMPKFGAGARSALVTTRCTVLVLLRRIMSSRSLPKMSHDESRNEASS